ncbi:MAG TPA: tetratricopeptide repeat protein [Bryobacteraceae bacterium]|nr:tetratricopeptide repeat protein [Bryobacteraceae bacterium]
MARLTRKELKSDKFALEVQHSVEFVSEHRQMLIRWGGIGVAVVILAVAFYVYRNHERTVRQEALHRALQYQNASVGQAGNEFMPAFATAGERDKAVTQAFTELATKYKGTDEGIMGEFFLGTNASDNGNLAEAEKHFKAVMDSGNRNYSAMAKMAMAQIYASQGKLSQGEALIQSVIDHPTDLVSKEQATLALGDLIRASDPKRALKLIEPLRSSPRATISKAAISAVSEIPQK